MKEINLPIDKLAEGKLQERIDYALKKIFDNIHDTETEATAARTLTIKIKLTPDSQREKIAVQTNINTNLANVIGVTTSVVTRRNQNTGAIEAAEMKSTVPGQTFFEDNGDLKTDTGENIKEFTGNWTN